jgi:uncharacterized protein (TIGR00297 family)
MNSPVWAVGASFALAFGAFFRGSLSFSGALAAWLVGTVIWVGLGIGGFGVLCAFFLTSTLLGRVGRARKAPLQESYSKSDRRDAWQVFANGGIAAFCALLLIAWRAWAPPSGAVPELLSIAACASLASANADTWATELGVLSRAQPIHVVRLERVPRGTSGAVSLLGLGVAALGAGAIALTAALLLTTAVPRWHLVVVLTGTGWFGAFFDSVLGATVQQQWVCTQCAQVVEVRRHCAAPSTVSGPRWAVLDNDHVNLLANALAAALAAAGLWLATYWPH